MKELDRNIQYIKGVGPKLAYKFKKLNIETIRDLLYYIPRDYEDMANFKNLDEAIEGEKISLEVEIIGRGNLLRPRKGLSILKIPFKNNDFIGYLVYFNQPYLIDKFKIGSGLIVNGKFNKMGMEFQIVNPIVELPNKTNKIGRIVPIYNLTEGVTNNRIISLIKNLLDENLKFVDEILPQDIIGKYNFPSAKDALENIHFPTSFEILKSARNRLAYEELLTLQLGLFMFKNKNSNKKGIQFKIKEEVYDFIKNLPYELTKAQYRVVEEIIQDMERPKQMNRLVQGDVGSGKTIVAIISIFEAILCGYQAVMMAPTEILADQHFISINNMLKKYGIKCELLVGSLTKKKKEDVLRQIKEGKIDVVIGTHAIIQDDVEFNRLGLAITDEQHRFGVKQRAILNQKGENPDVLVMTATPIPRTLALILYGDLDISIIDELPPGRQDIDTFAVGKNMEERIFNFVRKQILEGRQAYIVCPLIEESETLTIRSAEELYDYLKEDIFKDFKVDLLHGKMNTKEKDEIMGKFKDNKTNILVSTTVIEVGVNVPNANIMVIFNAERFGLAQLHQLRGRVGRGEYKSYCILINESMNPISRERMRMMQSTNDGFKISEKDLELRGPGEFFGTRQHGIPELRVANLLKDLDLLKLAQRDAEKILNQYPNLSSPELSKLKNSILGMFNKESRELDY